jgi:fructosamine-3-kinase
MNLILALIERMKSVLPKFGEVLYRKGEVLWCIKIAARNDHDEWCCQVLSSGCYNLVFASSMGDRVIRVARHRENDDASYEWLEHCMNTPEDQRPSWMPKVYAVGRIMGRQFAVIERLAEEVGAFGYYPEPFNDDLVVSPSRLYQSFPGIVQVLKDAYRKVREVCGDRLDLHSGNLMVRHDGTVVITDPAT